MLRLNEDENDTQARPEKFVYVLMYVDLFTRRVWLRALRSKTAIGVAREVSGWAPGAAIALPQPAAS